MKSNLLLTLGLLFCFQMALAQNGNSTDMKAKRFGEFQAFLGQISQVDFSNASSGVSLDLQNNSQVKFDLNYKYNKSKTESIRNFGSVSGVIGSNENLGQGRFLPKIELAVGGFVLLGKSLYFLNNDIWAAYQNTNSHAAQEVLQAAPAGYTPYSAAVPILQPAFHANPALNDPIRDAMPLSDANSIKLWWLNYGGTFKYNEISTLDSITMRDSLHEQASWNFFTQLNAFWMPGRRSKLLEHNNLLFTGSLRYAIEFGANNANSLDRVNLSETVDSAGTATIDNGTALLGSLESGTRHNATISLFAGMNVVDKLLLGVAADFGWEYHDTDQNHFTYLKISLALGNSSDPDIIKALQGLKVVPYVRFNNIHMAGKAGYSLKDNREFGIATIFPINTFVRK